MDDVRADVAVALGHVPQHGQYVATQLAGVGAAVLAVILQRQLAGHPGTAEQATAFSHTFVWALAYTALAILPALLLPRLPDKDTEPAPDEKPASERADAAKG